MHCRKVKNKYFGYTTHNKPRTTGPTVRNVDKSNKEDEETGEQTVKQNNSRGFNRKENAINIKRD